MCPNRLDVVLVPAYLRVFQRKFAGIAKEICCVFPRVFPKGNMLIHVGSAGVGVGGYGKGGMHTDEDEEEQDFGYAD